MTAIDTNVLIELEKGNKKVLSSLNQLRDSTPMSLPFPVLSEYYYGYLKEGTKNVQVALDRMEAFVILHSTKRAALLFSEVKYKLAKSGHVISDMDMLIAAICIDNGATLVTLDKQFEKIKELDKIILGF